MQPQNKYQKYLSIFLWLIGIHSFTVGIGLIFIPPSFLSNFGFINYSESFFQAQGGIFHIAMSIAYVMAASDIASSSKLINFIIIVKFLAFVFLMIYFLFILNSWLILLSGFADGLMGLIVLVLFRFTKQQTRFGD
jgi:hypothetical protein